MVLSSATNCRLIGKMFPSSKIQQIPGDSSGCCGIIYRHSQSITPAVHRITIYGAGDSPGDAVSILYRHSLPIARAVRYRSTWVRCSTWVPLSANAGLSIISPQPINHPGCPLCIHYGAGDSPGWRCAISYRHSLTIARAVRYRSTWVPLCANAG